MGVSQGRWTERRETGGEEPSRQPTAIAKRNKEVLTNHGSRRGEEVSHWGPEVIGCRLEAGRVQNDLGHHGTISQN